MPVRKETIEKARILVEAGKTKKEIAYATGLCSSTLNKYFPQLRRKDLISLLKAKDYSEMTYKEIAAELDFAKNHILKTLIKNDIPYKVIQQGGDRKSKNVRTTKNS